MIGNVDDGHGIQHDADEDGADDDVAHAALAARQADAADHHDEDDVVEQRRVDDAGVHASAGWTR